MRAHLRKSLLYPAFVLVLVLLVAALMLTQVVPQLASLLASTGESLPWSTQALLATSALLQQYGAPLAVAGLALAIGLPWLARQWPWLATTRDQLALRLPLWGPLQHKRGAGPLCRGPGHVERLRRALAGCLAGGEAVIDNQVLRHGVSLARRHIANGSGLSDGFAAVGILPPLVLRMLRVGESSGELARRWPRSATVISGRCVWPASGC